MVLLAGERFKPFFPRVSLRSLAPGFLFGALFSVPLFSLGSYRLTARKNLSGRPTLSLARPTLSGYLTDRPLPDLCRNVQIASAD
jgi:hypothetical protein